MTSILVVCTGNICRSPIAEGLLRDALSARFGDGAPTVSSAGTAGLEGRRAMAEVGDGRRASWGVDIAAHRARALTRSMPSEADLVIVHGRPSTATTLGGIATDAAIATFTLKELVRLLESLPPARRARARRRCADRVAGGDRAGERRVRRQPATTRTSPTRSGMPLQTLPGDRLGARRVDRAAGRRALRRRPPCPTASEEA